MKNAAIYCGLAVAVLLSGALFFKTLFSPKGLSLPGVTTKVTDDVTLSILHSEAMSFLVTRRTVTQVVVEHEETNILGDWHGVLWATVEFNWGVDLKKITAKDIRRDGNVIYCRLPEPQLLGEFAVEPGSIRSITKSTFVPKVWEMLNTGRQRDILEDRLKQRASDFANEKKLKPTRTQMLADTNNAVKIFKEAAGIDLRFE